MKHWLSKPFVISVSKIVASLEPMVLRRGTRLRVGVSAAEGPQFQAATSVIIVSRTVVRRSAQRMFSSLRLPFYREFHVGWVISFRLLLRRHGPYLLSLGTTKIAWESLPVAMIADDSDLRREALSMQVEP